MRNIISALTILLLIALGVYVFLSNQHTVKCVYVLNQKVFEGFKGKQELEQKLIQLRTKNKQTLDSLSKLIESDKSNVRIEAYRQVAENIQFSEQRLQEQYTSDIWKRINSSVVDYGKENDYDFIFGATGDGSLMFARDAKNVTDQVIEFINREYEK